MSTTAVIDGEVIAADDIGRPQFYDLLRSVRAPAYVAFDLLWLNGADRSTAQRAPP
jgi:ATP-dependent DNA ligase